jgi:hypothetical protein
MSNSFDSRQTIYRGNLTRLAASATPSLNTLLGSINSEITPAFGFGVTGTDTIVTLGASVITNTVTGISHTLPTIGSNTPNVATSTITFTWSASIITATPSIGIVSTAALGTSAYIKGLVYIDGSNNVNVLFGTQNAVESTANVLAVPPGTIAVGYISLQTVSSILQNITTAKIFQFPSANTSPFFGSPVFTDATSTGSSATLISFTSGNISLTNNSLVSISGIPAGYNGQALIVENNTGNTLNILNDNAGATAVNRIYTGTGNALAMANQASLIFSYNITNSRWMLVAGSGGASPGVGASVALNSGINSGTITFASPQSGTNYVILAQLVNLIDANPAIQTIIVVVKNTTGFNWKINSATDSANYLIDYKILTNSTGSGVQVGETILTTGTSTAVITIPTPYTTATYVVACGLVNYTDTNPQFQPVIVTAKTNSTFTVRWNSNLDSSNYRLAYNIS